MMADFRTELTHRKRITLEVGHATLRELLEEYASNATGMPIDGITHYEIRLQQVGGVWLRADIVITQDLTRYGDSDG